MNDLVALHFQQADVRMVMRDGVPWWVGIDVADLLEIRDRYQALRALEDYERGMYIIPTPSGDQQMIVINESGLYSMLMKSRKPTAKAFKKWLTTEVLPSIRTWGQYPPPQFALEDPDRDQDRRTTPLQRFLSECARVAPKHGLSPDQLITNLLSEGYRKQIKNGSLNVENALHKGKSWRSCHAHGMDLRYVLTGVWDVTPQERRIAAKMRAAQDAHQIEAAPSRGAIQCEP